MLLGLQNLLILCPSGTAPRHTSCVLHLLTRDSHSSACCSEAPVSDSTTDIAQHLLPVSGLSRFFRIMSSRSLRVVSNDSISFQWPNNIPLCACSPVSLSFHLSTLSSSFLMYAFNAVTLRPSAAWAASAL